ARPLAWLPASRRLVPARLRRAAQVHCLDERQQSHPLAAQGAPAAVDRSALGDALAALLTRLACCVRVEPGLLRALRRLEAGAAAEPGLEALVWGNRQHVAAGERFCEIAPARVADWRERFREKLQAAEQSAVLREMLRFHAFRGRSTEAAELLIWHAHAGEEARQAFAARVAQARDWFARFALRADAADGEASAYAADLLARNRGDRAWLEQHSPVLAPLWVLSGEDEVPAGLDARQVALALQAVAAQPPSQREFVLVQRDDTLALALARAAPGGSRWPLLRLAGEVIPVRVGRQTRRLRLPADDAVLPLAESSAERVEVFAGTHAYACQRVQRPAWASEIGRDRYGVYLEATIAGVVQRLRWIEPGEFRMGSPPDERGRFDDEGPQHRVRLTRGFWLADTACTQALWQAVMGDNPSRFQRDVRQPVEQVLWDDVQRFLETLRVLLPGAEADLPSEAEWEYACRAGTTTPFSFGETIDTQQANYHGNRPYADGAQGEYRQTTVPVKTFPANAWGLYEMHGNVWEWCADGLRRYDGAECEDPRGPEGEGDSRVVRGGSWNYDGRLVRSAVRDWDVPGYRYRSVGFRLALRSMRGRGAPAPEGQEATAAFAGREGAG
ncbi:MAG TPA: formylglycine-generating enzyme family protein, partial [Plasticicumulans sp.]|uniref:formylglycine-generating enzyme family protein n=1 Tax=Plasticicumulans sp. TaxID=2307179 RepID=UPI002C4326B6